MSNQLERVIHRSSLAAQAEVKELLAGIFAAELVAPSAKLWLVSPWIRDVRLLDNRGAAFRGVGPSWGRRQLGIFDVLAELCRRRTEVTVVTRSSDDNPRAMDELERLVGEGFAAARLRICYRDDLHTKGLVGEDYCVRGSMNFTRNGIEKLDEWVTYSTDERVVGEARLSFQEYYGSEK